MYQLAYFMMMLCKQLIIRSGANFEQVVCIVKCKILMDNRKGTRSGKTSSYARNLQLIFYVLLGAIVSGMIWKGSHIYTTYFMIFSVIMMIAVMNLIAEFHTLLFDTRDNTIIVPRPVSERTFLFSRIFHVSSYLLAISLAFSIVPTIATVVRFDFITGLAFFAEVIFCILIAMVLTFVFYLGLLRFTTGERFKDIVSYFQIAMGIIFFGAYQFLPNIMAGIKTDNLFAGNWWIMLAPPAWMAGFTGSIATLKFDAPNILASFLSIAMPLFGLWLIAKVLAPGYSRKLVELEQGELTDAKKAAKASIRSYSAFLARFFTRTPAESATFRSIWKIAARDRDFKQLVYPSLGMNLIMLFVIIFKNVKSYHSLASSNVYVLFIYIPLLLLFSVWSAIKISDNYKSAWFYRAVPLQNPGEIISGTLKVAIIQLFVPFYLLCNALTMYVWGIGHIFHIMAGFFLILNVTVGYLLLTRCNLPFSVEKSAARGGKATLFVFLFMIVAAAMGGFHYLLIKLGINMIFASVVLLLLNCFLFSRLRKMGWNKIEFINV